MLPQPPRLVFTTGDAGRATDAFRLDAVDYLLKPLDPEQVTEAVNRLLAHLRPFESSPSPLSARRGDSVPAPDKILFTGSDSDLLPVKDVDRDQVRWTLISASCCLFGQIPNAPVWRTFTAIRTIRVGLSKNSVRWREGILEAPQFRGSPAVMLRENMETLIFALIQCAPTTREGGR